MPESSTVFLQHLGAVEGRDFAKLVALLYHENSHVLADQQGKASPEIVNEERMAALTENVFRSSIGLPQRPLCYEFGTQPLVAVDGSVALLTPSGDPASPEWVSGTLFRNRAIDLFLKLALAVKHAQSTAAMSDLDSLDAATIERLNIMQGLSLTARDADYPINATESGEEDGGPVSCLRVLPTAMILPRLRLGQIGIPIEAVQVQCASIARKQS